VKNTLRMIRLTAIWYLIGSIAPMVALVLVEVVAG